MAAAEESPAAPAGGRRRKPIRYRRRLRSRIILSYVLLGFNLTLALAFANYYARNRVENQLVEDVMNRNIEELARRFYANPGSRPEVAFQQMRAYAFAPESDRLKRDFPELEIVINGGITSLDTAATELDRVDGVMLGPAAYQDPWILAEVDSRLFGEEDPLQSRDQAAQALLPWLEDLQGRGVPVKAVTRHILGLFNGLPGARAW